MIKKFAFLLIILFVSIHAWSQNNEGNFILSHKLDIPLGVACTGSFVVGNLLQDEQEKMPEFNLINRIDRHTAFEYNERLDFMSKIGMAASILSPVFFLFEFQENYWTHAAMYAESTILAFSIKDILKARTCRYRPYMYFASIPEQYVEEGDHINSFPSGHTTAAFMGAGFTTAVFAIKYSDSKIKIPVIAGSYVFAASTALFRILSGNHFLTDVAAGALIGTIIGIGIPLAHWRS